MRFKRSIAFVAEGTPDSNSTLQIEAKLVNTEGIDVTTEGTAALNVWNGTALEKIEDVKTSTARYYTINLNQCIKLGDTNKYTVTINSADVFAGETPKFKVYYTNNGKKTALTTTIVKTTNNKDGTVTYGLKFRAPNAVGSFPLEIHYVSAAGESDEFMTTTIKVRR